MSDRPVKKLLDDSRDYLYNQADLLKLDFAQKLARVLGMMILIFALLIIGLVAIVFASMVLAQLLVSLLGQTAAYVIVGGLYVVLIVSLIVFREQILFRPLTSTIGSILLGSEMSGEQIVSETERLRVATAHGEKTIEADYEALKEEVSNPFSFFSFAKHLPTIFTIATTIWPIIRNLKIKR